MKPSLRPFNPSALQPSFQTPLKQASPSLLLKPSSPTPPPSRLLEVPERSTKSPSSRTCLPCPFNLHFNSTHPQCTSQKAQVFHASVLSVSGCNLRRLCFDVSISLWVLGWYWSSRESRRVLMALHHRHKSSDAPRRPSRHSLLRRRPFPDIANCSCRRVPCATRDGMLQCLFSGESRDI